MTLHIAVDPALDLTAEEFAATWNKSPHATSLSPATTATDPATVNLPPELIGTGMVILSNLALNVVSNAVYDLIKQTLAQRKVTKKTEIIQLEQPDGTKLLVIRIEE